MTGGHSPFCCHAPGSLLLDPLSLTLTGSLGVQDSGFMGVSRAGYCGAAGGRGEVCLGERQAGGQPSGRGKPGRWHEPRPCCGQERPTGPAVWPNKTSGAEGQRWATVYHFMGQGAVKRSSTLIPLVGTWEMLFSFSESIFWKSMLRDGRSSTSVRFSA